MTRKSREEGENKMLGVGRSGEISMRRQFFFFMGARGIWCTL